MSTPTYISNLLKDAEGRELRVISKITKATVTWPESAPPYTTIPVLGQEVDITDNMTDWNISRSRQSACAVFTGSFQMDETGDADTNGVPDYNEAIIVYQRIASDTYMTDWIKIGTFLVDVSPAATELLPGMRTINARDPMKMMKRREWTGRLEPDKVAYTEIDLEKDFRQGQEYYEFYHGTSQNAHTINWAASPMPKIWVKKSDDSKGKAIPVDGTNVLVLFGLGVIRINKYWFDDKYGSKKEVMCSYSRYALWEDTFDDPTYDINSPEVIIETMAKYAGFQDSDSSGLFYIKSIEPVTLPRASTGTWAYASSAYSDKTLAANDDAAADVTFCAAAGDILYVGVWEQRFCGLHITISTAMVGGTVVYEYWNGSSWASITPDLDSTLSLTQSGQVIWKNSTFSSWAKSVPSAGMPTAYWARIRCTSAPSTAPIATSVLPGFPIYCATPRYTTFDDMRPQDVLDKVLKPFVLPNYYWYCDSDGNFNATHTYQQATPEYTLTALTKAESDPLRDDQIFTTVNLRGKRYDRLNASASMNGGSIILAPTLQKTDRTVVGNVTNLNDGKLSNMCQVKYPKDDAPTEPVDLWIVRLAQAGAGAEIYELDIKGGTTYSAEAETITGVITDRDGENEHSIDYSASPIDLTKITIQLSAISANCVLLIEIRIDEKEWISIGSVEEDDGLGLITFSGLNYEDVQGIRVRISKKGLIAKSATISSFTVYSSTKNELTGTVTWTASPSGTDAAAHDSNTSTSTQLSEYGHYVNANFGAQAVEEINLTASVGGILNLEYKKDGDSTYTLFKQLQGLGKQKLTFSDLAAGNEFVSGSTDWSAVTDVRAFLSASAEDGELSEIILQNREGHDDFPTFSIYYSSTSTDNWEPLDKCENIIPQTGRFSVTKQDFGDMIYPKSIKFVVERWANGGSGDNYAAHLSEIQVWLNDTIYGSASYGVTYPYNDQTSLDFAAKMGFPSYNAPFIDASASTQRAVDYNALQLLRELTRVYASVKVNGFRPDVILGDTVAIETFLDTFLAVGDTIFVVEGVEYSSEGQASIMLMPFL